MSFTTKPPTAKSSSPSKGATKSRSSTPVPNAAASNMPLSGFSAQKNDFWMLQDLPFELQVRALSYLRAHDLSAAHRVNRFTREAVQLQHAIVVYCAEEVYPVKWTRGFQDQPISSSIAAAATSKHGKGGKSAYHSSGRPRSKSRGNSLGSLDDVTESSVEASAFDANTTTTNGGATSTLYTFEHLRNMELLVVARVLSSPEPATGFVVSKSWCKTALCWLEGQQEKIYHQQEQLSSDAALGKKKKGKKVRAKQRFALSAACAPPPANNINSDITCSHDQLQHYTSIKSARARRRLLDKQAWKILKALYPESTPLPTISSECLQCRAEACQALKVVTDQQEAANHERRVPLKDPAIRRFYTRTRGVPENCVRGRDSTNNASTILECYGDNVVELKMPATPVKSDHASLSSCPLIDGTYYVLPRAWCHGWRRFLKTGEGAMANGTFVPPDAASLLCDAHNLALLPPHLEAFLYGESSQLLESAGFNSSATTCINIPVVVSPLTPLASLPPGQAPTRESIEAMRQLGLNENEISRQVSAMRSIEAQQQRIQREISAQHAAAVQAENNTIASRNELLDRENHSVVEILSLAEFQALAECWPGTNLFALRFTVQTTSKVIVDATSDSVVCGGVNFCTPVCRSCDTTGRQCSMSIKNRARGWVKKSADKARSPASLEY